MKTVSEIIDDHLDEIGFEGDLPTELRLVLNPEHFPTKGWQPNRIYALQTEHGCIAIKFDSTIETIGFEAAPPGGLWTVNTL